jgi:hypothetical protein
MRVPPSLLIRKLNTTSGSGLGGEQPILSPANACEPIELLPTKLFGRGRHRVSLQSDLFARGSARADEFI